MKTIKQLGFILTLAVLSLSSCKKEPEDRLPGDWTMIWTTNYTIEYFGQTESESETNLGLGTFNEDGTGYLTLDGDTEAMIWSATEDSVTIDVDGETYSFAILENEKDDQLWETHQKETFETYGYNENYEYVPFPYSYEWDITVKLERRD